MASSVWLSSSSPSPLLRGGHSLSKRLQGMIHDNANQEHDFMKKYASSIPTSPTTRQTYMFQESSPDSATKTRASFVTKQTSSVDGESQEVSYLRTSITKHEQRLDAMEKTVLRLETGGATNSRQLSQVRRKLGQHESIFQDTLSQTQRSLQQHADMIIKQQHVTKMLVSVRKEREDVMFDTGFLMLSLYIVQTPLVQFTIQIVTSRWVRGVQRHRKWLPRVLQVAYIFHIYHILKYLNIKTGLSHKFWEGTQFMTRRLQSIGWHLAKIFTYPRNVLSQNAPGSRTSPKTPETPVEHTLSPIHVTGPSQPDASTPKPTKLAKRPNGLKLSMNGAQNQNLPLGQKLLSTMPKHPRVGNNANGISPSRPVPAGLELVEEPVLVQGNGHGEASGVFLKRGKHSRPVNFFTS